MGDRADEWIVSIMKEFDGLNDQQVFSHDWSKEKLAEAGIRGSPVPCSTALTHKYKDWKLDKLKTRICIAGHPGNVKKGIHYDEVFSPAPFQHTERFLQAMWANLRLANLTWDIKQAYTWAPLPPGERIAVVYPDGFKRQDSDGNELFAVLEKNLYGMPNAARGWGQHRDEFIIRRFNQKGWRCTKSTSDPCLFIIDKIQPDDRWKTDFTKEKLKPYYDAEEGLPNDASRSWILIHTDDCDAYGQCRDDLDEIYKIMNDRWAAEIVPSDFVLGVKRTRVEDNDNGWYSEMTMPSFIQDLYNLFKDDMETHFGKAKCHSKRFPTPFPEKCILSKSSEVDDDEIKRNIKRGYQKLIGSLLWVVRHCSPICSYGCSQLCKLMATPSDEAWAGALHMLGYLYSNKERGIRFSQNDDMPVCYVDASNKDDPNDGKTQYGYSIQWGGPLITKSGKLGHVGINSTYNEYMALHHCIKQTVWMRQLFHECGIAHLNAKPTTTFADNKQANKICKEDLVTAGNMYFRTGYHYNKEAQRDGYVDVVYIKTDSNISDATTKALASNKIKEFEPQLHGYEALGH